MKRSLKAPRNPQKISCTLEIAVMQGSQYNDSGENVIRIATPSGKNLLSLSISREIGQHIASALAQASPSISIDGSVSTMFDDAFEQTNQTATVALDQLVAEAVAPEMLEDEPDAVQMLSKFHIRLLKSLELVEQVIATRPKD